MKYLEKNIANLSTTKPKLTGLQLAMAVHIGIHCEESEAFFIRQICMS